MTQRSHSSRFNQNHRNSLVWMVILGLITTGSLGCSKTESTRQASTGEEPLPPLPSDASDESLPSDVDSSQRSEFISQPAPGDTATVEPKGWPSPTSALSIEQESEDATVKPELQLRNDLTPEKLVDFLSACDQDMELIYSGRSGLKSREAEVAEMQRIIRMKLEASRRLVAHADATDEQRVTGKRGELQSLSHLASGGSLKAAEELEVIAKAGLESNDPSFASDSRLVLVGFELESLQNGNELAPQKIVDLVEQFTPNPQAPDVPALMVMGQARELLSQYGHVDEAKRVREKILATFADDANPEVAMMAAKLAGAVQFDGVDKLRAAALAGQSVTPAQWKAAAQTLIDESRDMMTVQYLATAALELQGSGNDPLAAATYEVLQQNFTDPTEALGREVNVAIEAARARADIIGTPFDFQLPSLGGETIEMSDYRGRVVLMPFWAAEFPASLQLLPNIINLRERNPNHVAIVGVNLDSRASDQTINAKEKLGFPSLHSATEPGAEVPNPIVKQFGMVSLPFLVILDRDGKVADVCFTERQLQSSTQRLLAQE